MIYVLFSLAALVFLNFCFLFFEVLLLCLICELLDQGLDQLIKYLKNKYDLH